MRKPHPDCGGMRHAHWDGCKVLGKPLAGMVEKLLVGMVRKSLVGMETGSG
jgi:hypothetical protein